MDKELSAGWGGRIRTPAAAGWPLSKNFSRFDPPTSETGWGGRIRTCECRYQKPVPYHLATPQQDARERNAALIAAPAGLKTAPALAVGHPAVDEVVIVLGELARQVADLEIPRAGRADEASLRPRCR